jgi:hypothetical protein
VHCNETKTLHAQLAAFFAIIVLGWLPATNRVFSWPVDDMMSFNSIALYAPLNAMVLAEPWSRVKC